MKYIISILLFSLFSCNTTSNYIPATEALDAAREFLDGCYRGNFNKASFYMLQDDENNKLLKKSIENYAAKSAMQQKQYAESSLQNVTVEEISATETIINYKNSYDKVGRKVKAVLVNNIWLIDYKYTYDPNL